MGRNVVHRMLGQHVFSFASERIDKTKSLCSSSAVVVAPGKSIHPGLLFQHFLFVFWTGQLDLEEMMRCELSVYPTSLFEDIHILRKTYNPQLTHAISEHFNNGASIETTPDSVSCTERYIIDEGYLMRKLKWKKRDKHCKIDMVYAGFRIKHYWMTAVVFGRYDAGP